MWLLPLARPPILSLISCWHSSPSSPGLPVTDPSTLFPSFLHFLPPSSLALLSLLAVLLLTFHLNSICLTTPSPHPPTAPSLTFHHLLTLTPAFGYFLPSFHPPSTLHQLYIYIYIIFLKRQPLHHKLDVVRQFSAVCFYINENEQSDRYMNIAQYTHQWERGEQMKAAGEY